MSPAKVRLSLLEKKDLAIRLLLGMFVLYYALGGYCHWFGPDKTPAPPQLLLYLALALPRALRRSIPLRLWFTSALFRYSLGHLKPRHIQALAPTSLEVYSTWIQKMQVQQAQQVIPSEQQLRHRVVPLSTDPSSSILWIGDVKRATRFVLFFHGGGYMAPLNPGHLNWCWNAYIQNKEGKLPGKNMTGDEVAVAVLQYSLSPGAKYPTQLRQAVAALNHIIGEGIDPQNMILGGDSAGGNLSLQLLHHLIHPIPGIESVSLEMCRFAGVFLVSPWVSGQTNTASFRDNELVDMLSASIVKDSEMYVLGPGNDRVSTSKSHLALPLDGDLAWLQGIQGVTESLYVTCGDQEVFRDHVLVFCEAIRCRNSDLKLTVDVSAGEVHDWILLEGSHGLVGGATERMRRWASSRLQNRDLD